MPNDNPGIAAASPRRDLTRIGIRIRILEWTSETESCRSLPKEPTEGWHDICLKIYARKPQAVVRDDDFDPSVLLPAREFLELIGQRAGKAARAPVTDGESRDYRLGDSSSRESTRMPSVRDT
jgi:hypothetical protein